MTGGVAVVLGRTGRNVAAGMSGGIGYFLDLDEARLNTEMVDALAPTEADLEFLKGLISRHYEETESAVAAALLADWEAARTRFTKVLPRDYARVIAAREQAETDGLDEATTTVRMMEAARWAAHPLLWPPVGNLCIHRLLTVYTVATCASARTYDT